MTLSEKIIKFKDVLDLTRDNIYVDDIKEFILMTNWDMNLVRVGRMSISKFIRKFKQRAGKELI